MSDKIKLAELRRLASSLQSLPWWRLTLKEDAARNALPTLIRCAEALHNMVDDGCGCPECEDGVAALSAFDFEEE